MHYIFCNSYPVQILFFQISFWGGGLILPQRATWKGSSLSQREMI